MGISFIPLVVVTMVLIITSFGCAVRKRSTVGDDIANNIDYPDYSPKYDESYPVSEENVDHSEFNSYKSSGIISKSSKSRVSRMISCDASSSHL